ncbi:hypothetical protein FDECE_8919 [Fusarium decemcellulare]|nr:hypothetical protein FDECE_8919 [Fusarium decemcellulare]
MSGASTEKSGSDLNQSQIAASVATNDGRVNIENKDCGNDKGASVDNGAVDNDQLQDNNLKRRHSEAFDGNEASTNSGTDNSTSGDRLVKSGQLSIEEDSPVVASRGDSKDETEIVKQSEAFVEKDGDYVFDHTRIILRKGKDYFSAIVNQRERELERLDLSSLEKTPIPRESFCPEFKEGFTRAPESLSPGSSGDVYLKQPSLLPWDPTDTNPRQIAEVVLQEAEICETLKENPHPNVVRYLGCLVEDGRIVALVLAKYRMQLSDKLAESSPAERQMYYEGVERGVQHLHQLGLVHNDLNPSNIMLDGTNPVIIDFDSCRPKGEEIGAKAGTFGWDLEEAEYAVPENDLHSLDKLKEYILNGGEIDFD